MTPFIEINGRKVGVGHPVYIIAEISANHHQRLDEAIRLVEAAKEARADAVKLQTYTPDTLTIQCERPPFLIGGGTLWDGQTLHALYSKAYMPWEWHEPLINRAKELGISIFSTAYDATAVDLLERLGTPAFKLASFENVDLPLIRRMAQTGKPLIMSTGMASLDEVKEAVETARAAGARELALLKCTSSYPAAPGEMNLRAILHLQETFGVPVGLSDHTLGTAASVASVALGACLIERHLTLSRSTPGPDSSFSMEPREFKSLVDDVRTVEEALGEVRYGVTPGEKKSLVFRRSLFVVKDMNSGEIFTAENVRSIRPGHGLHTRHLQEILGKRSSRKIERGTPLAWDLVNQQPA